MQLPSSFVAVFSAALLFLFFFAAGAGALSCHECDEVDTAVRYAWGEERVLVGPIVLFLLHCVIFYIFSSLLFVPICETDDMNQIST